MQKNIKFSLFTKLITALSGVRLENTTPISFNAVTNAYSSKKPKYSLFFFLLIQFNLEMMLDKQYHSMNQYAFYFLVQLYDMLQEE